MVTTQHEPAGASPLAKAPNPWAALAALCVGFFMILLDMTIVAVANPAILTGLHTTMPNVIWVTSSYLLAYAVPLLVAGRLGDRYGPKNLYLGGLTIFTLASLWCGLSGSIEMLITARAAQGLGAALMTPQTMAVITRTFPADKRGAAMGFWGAIAGVATLVGPILGGVLVDGLGWEWIFIVNVPIGIIAFALAFIFVPKLPTHPHKFDILGVVLSGAGLFLLVFGLQEGNTYDWSWWIWTLIVAGLAVIAGFVVYQARNKKGEPLLPLSLFKDRNFTLANVAISSMGAAITALMVPGFFYLQAVHEFSPTKAALVFAPMAVVTFILAPILARFVNTTHPALLPTVGFTIMVTGIIWFAQVMTPHASILDIMLPNAYLGIASACIWAPLATTATRNLPPAYAGAGAGVYNTTRQVGAVIGSAAISALVTQRMSAHGIPVRAQEGQTGGHLPDVVRADFSSALSEAQYLPAGILVIGVIASALFIRAKKATPADTKAAAAQEVPSLSGH
jgi:EmrB/QacA subfamily drug resistance transporter